MEIQSDFKELLELFNAHSVDYIIVGGYALAFHGAPRFTGDMDLFVRADSENAKHVIIALNEFGFGSLDLTVDDFQMPENVIQLGVPPVRVDILTSLTAVSWEKAESGKVAAQYGDVPVNYIGKSDLVSNKKALHRNKDMADLEALGED